MNNKKILQSLIDSGKCEKFESYGNVLYVFREAKLHLFESKMADGFDPFLQDPELFLFLQQALFDACAERGFIVKVVSNALTIDAYEDDGDLGTKIIRWYEGNTTRESWVEAYKKVMGIEA